MAERSARRPDRSATRSSGLTNLVVELCEWTYRQTNRHADGNTSHPYRKQSNNKAMLLCNNYRLIRRTVTADDGDCNRL